MRLRRLSNFIIDIGEIFMSIGFTIMAGLFLGGIVAIAIILFTWLGWDIIKETFTSLTL